MSVDRRAGRGRTHELHADMVYQRFLKSLERVLSTVMVALVVMMVVSISFEIILREVIQALLWELTSATPEWLTKMSAPLNTASQTLLVWIGLLGSTLAFRYRSHLGVDALVRLYPRKVQVALDFVSTLLVALFSGSVLVYGGWNVCTRALKGKFLMPGFEQLNRAWFYMVLPLTGGLILLFSVDFFLHPRPVEPATPTDDTPEGP